MPLQYILRIGSSVTTATAVASKFSSFDNLMNFSTLSLSSTTAILSCDSEIASSVPSRPSYFFGTLSRSMIRPSASSPIATQTPPAPKSLQRLIIVETSGFLKRRWIFLSVGGLPFCTSAPQVSIELVSCAFEEPVAPPQPSRPVLPPSKTITSPSAGTSRTTLDFGEAPTTAPISRRFAW